MFQTKKVVRFKGKHKRIPLTLVTVVKVKITLNF